MLRNHKSKKPFFLNYLVDLLVYVVLSEILHQLSALSKSFIHIPDFRWVSSCSVPRKGECIDPVSSLAPRFPPKSRDTCVGVGRSQARLFLGPTSSYLVLRSGTWCQFVCVCVRLVNSDPL